MEAGSVVVEPVELNSSARDFSMLHLPQPQLRHPRASTRGSHPFFARISQR